MTEEQLTPPPPNGPFLRFPDETTGMAALEAAGLLATDEDGIKRPITASHAHALDVIGAIVRGGEWDPETGEVLTPPTLLDGWHINYIGELPDGWEQYVVRPTNPVRVFL
jgi:hypothetical protein